MKDCFVKLLEQENDSDYKANQEKLFHKHFASEEIEEITLEVRGIIDEVVREIGGEAMQKEKEQIKWFTTFNQYPFWFCHHITHSVSAILRNTCSHHMLQESTRLSRKIVDTIQYHDMLEGTKLRRRSLTSRILRFEREGGVFWPVWGIIPREDCFQWFILAGNHVINTANDAGDPKVYPIDITPLSQATYRSILDYEDYINIATKYWGHTVYKNTILPSIAPIYPLVAIDTQGALVFPSPKVLEFRSIASNLELSKRVFQNAQLKPAPENIKEVCSEYYAPESVDLRASFSKWEELLREPPEDEYRKAYFQRARYLIEWLEFEWAMNGKSWALVEKM